MALKLGIWTLNIIYGWMVICGNYVIVIVIVNVNVIIAIIINFVIM